MHSRLNKYFHPSIFSLDHVAKYYHDFTYKYARGTQSQCFKDICSTTNTAIQENRNSSLSSFNNLVVKTEPIMSKHYEN